MATMNLIHHPLPPGWMDISYYPNQASPYQGGGYSKTYRRNTINRIEGLKIPKAEKDELIHQFLARQMSATSNPPRSPTPRTRLPRTAAYNFSAMRNDWPKVHVEMELQELIAARTALMTMFTQIGMAENNALALLRKAHALCETLWNTVITLRGLLWCVEKQDEVPDTLYVSAINDMEQAVDRMTCRMLDESNVRVRTRRGSEGSLNWPIIRKRIGGSVEDIEGLVEIGGMLIKGFQKQQWLYMKGILETFHLFSISRKNKEKNEKNRYSREEHLMSKALFIRRCEKRNDWYNGASTGGLNRTAHDYYPPLTGAFSLPRRPLSPTGIPLRPPPPARKNGYLNSPTSSNSDPLGSVVRKRRKRPQDSESKVYREAKAYDSDSDSSIDEEPRAKSEFSFSKRPRPNPSTLLLAEPEPGPVSEETPEMRKFRMEIEGVSIAEDGADISKVKIEQAEVHEVPIKVEQGATLDGVDAVDNDIDSCCDLFRLAAKIEGDGMDEVLGDGGGKDTVKSAIASGEGVVEPA